MAVVAWRAYGSRDGWRSPQSTYPSQHEVFQFSDPLRPVNISLIKRFLYCVTKPRPFKPVFRCGLEQKGEARIAPSEGQSGSLSWGAGGGRQNRKKAQRRNDQSSRSTRCFRVCFSDSESPRGPITLANYAPGRPGPSRITEPLTHPLGAMDRTPGPLKPGAVAPINMAEGHGLARR